VLSSMKSKLNGTVKFIFQPAEEGGGGAKFMIADGVLDEGKFGPKVDEIYGLHVWNYVPYPLVAVKQGPIMGSSDRFHISIKGKGGHGAIPEGTNDAIVAAAHLVTMLQTVVSRNVSPMKSAVITVGTFNGGFAPNVIADTVDVSGTIRAFSEDVHVLVIERIKTICEGLAKSFGVVADCKVVYGYPVTVNRTKEHVDKLIASAEKIVGAENVVAPAGTMCAEDMSFFLEKVDGCFFFVGSAPRPEEEEVPHHKSNFDIDERALLVGSSVFVQLIEDLLA